MFTRDLDGLLGERRDLAHAEAEAHELLTERHHTAAEARDQPAEEATAPLPLAVELGNQFGGAGNGFDHPCNRSVVGLALQKAEHHADGLLGRVGGDSDIVGNARDEFVHQSSPRDI